MTPALLPLIGPTPDVFTTHLTHPHDNWLLSIGSLGMQPSVSPSRTPAPWVKDTVLALDISPASRAAYLTAAVQQTLVTDGKPPSLIRFHKVVQNLNKHKVDFGAIKYTTKKSQEEKETEDFYLECTVFLSKRAKQVQN